MLYDRDFRVLTPEEQEQLDKAEAFSSLIKAKKDGVWSYNSLIRYHKMHPRAAYFFNSLFPNNHLHTGDLEDKKALKEIKHKFSVLIDDPQTSERDILKFVAEHSAYCLVASVSQNFSFGHHDMYLFKEFPLSTNFVCDYLVVGKNSHGYHLIFVEIEKPFGEITTKNGEFGTTIRKGIKQVDDWDEWLDANFHSLRSTFEKYLKPGQTLPRELSVLDKSRINYVVIAGRRNDFNDRTYIQKRKLARQKNIHLLHFDNLIEMFEIVLKLENY